MLVETTGGAIRIPQRGFGAFGVVPLIIPFIPLIAAGVAAAAGITTAVITANVRAAEQETEMKRWQLQMEEAEKQRRAQLRIAAEKAKSRRQLFYLGGGLLGLGALYLVLR